MAPIEKKQNSLVRAALMIAVARATRLWQRHNENGVLLLSDIDELVGISYDNLYKSFANHKISAPVVWNSAAAKVDRKAALIRAEAKKLGVTELTRKQVAKVLGIRPRTVGDVLVQVRHWGYEIPNVEGADQIGSEVVEL